MKFRPGLKSLRFKSCAKVIRLGIYSQLSLAYVDLQGVQTLCRKGLRSQVGSLTSCAVTPCKRGMCGHVLGACCPLHHVRHLYTMCKQDVWPFCKPFDTRRGLMERGLKRLNAQCMRFCLVSVLFNCLSLLLRTVLSPIDELRTHTVSSCQHLHRYTAILSDSTIARTSRFCKRMPAPAQPYMPVAIRLRAIHYRIVWLYEGTPVPAQLCKNIIETIAHQGRRHNSCVWGDFDVLPRARTFPTGQLGG